MEYLRALLPRVTRTQVIIIGLATTPVVLGGAGILAVLLFLMSSGGTITPAPDQPIAFDHTVHAGEAVTIPKEWTGIWDTDGYEKIWVIYSSDE